MDEGVAGSAGGEEPEGGDSRAALELLLRVQDHDLEIDRLRHRREYLPERARLAEIRSAVNALDKRAAVLRAERSGPGARQGELEAEIRAATDRIGLIDLRLYNAQGLAYRDQQAMMDEVAHLKKRITSLEDEELEVMEALEPLDAELATITVERAALVAEGDSLARVIGELSADLDRQAEQVQAERESLAPGLPSDLSSRYERLRAKLGGIGAARLEHGACGGCHLDLSAMELDRIRQLPAGTLVQCEHCGRILVP